MADAIREGHIKLSERSCTQATVVAEAVAALKTLHRIDQGAVVELWILGEDGVGRQITDEPEKTSETWDPRIRLVWVDGLRGNRQPFAIIGAGQRDVMFESLFTAAIGSERRLNDVERGWEIRRGQNSFAQEEREIVFFVFDVKVEFKMTWIDPPDAKIRDVAHSANGESDVESGDVGVGATQ